MGWGGVGWGGRGVLVVDTNWTATIRSSSACRLCCDCAVREGRVI